MKMFIVSLFSVLSFGQAFATQPVPSVLEYQQVPAFNEVVGRLKSVTVYANGNVVAQERSRDGFRMVGVKQLNSYQMDRIFNLIQEARDGEVKKVMPGVACFRANDFLHKYTAERGRVMLYFGHVCNGMLTVNTSNAATSLKTTLNTLVQTMFKSPTEE